MPTGQFAMCWRATSHTHRAPEAKPNTSDQVVGAPKDVKAGEPSQFSSESNILTPELLSSN